MTTFLSEDPRILAPPWTLTKPGVTEEEYFEIGDEDARIELVDGVLYVHSPENIDHNDDREFLIVLLRQFCEETGFGRTCDTNSPLRLGTGRIFEPDILCVRRERYGQLARTRVQAPVDLVVEIVSPHDRPHDLVTKRPMYREAAIDEAWYVDGEHRRIEVDFRAPGAGTYESLTISHGRLVSRALPGFWIDVGWLWTRPLPSTLAKTLEILGRSQSPGRQPPAGP